MIISFNVIKYLKGTPNSAYESIKTEFLYHSNKLEGSTFTKENLEKYLQQNIIEGSHKIDDVYETINSTKLFDFVVETLNEPLSKRLILEFHRMLKDKTLDHERGFAGCWKKIPNMISGIDLKLAQPWEVDIQIDELLSWWETSDKSFQDIAKFHARFENIHPFQDGNGRIGRFLMLKQCIENEVDLVLIDDRYSKEYKEALYIAQSKKDMSGLLNIFEKCQNLLDEKLSFLKETIEYMQKYDIGMDSQSM
ncbi:Fic family protein [Thomasclavelia cocleata]|jgi:Fic family protein|uniref:Fic family protein n=1 Tax=Thomasclavelia cocleata TaxID=69824 RepID=UPI002570D2B7|nr:Fic family protein [Thomasclavelia cocleata]